MSLKKQALKGVKWTTLSTGVNALLQLVQLMILARYLSADAFGIIAILGVVVAFSQLFVDFGLSKATIHRQDVTETQLSTMYWLNVLLALFIFSIVFLISDYIAKFYDKESLGIYIPVLTSVLIIQAFGQQFRTLFQKELNFSVLAKIDIISAIISFLSLLIFVYLDTGVYAYIWSYLLLMGCRSFMLVLKGMGIHKPRLVMNINDVRSFLKFGMYTVGNDIVSTIATRVDVILIGKLLGTETLGAYNVIKELILRPVQIINPIITKVSFPLMAKLNNDLKEVKKVYLKIVSIVFWINFVVYAIAILLAPLIVEIFLGQKWLPYTEIFQILAAWALVRSVWNPIGSLLMAIGKPEIEMYWNSALLFYTPVVVYISSFFGIEGVAIGYVISGFILFVPAWYFLLYKTLQVRFFEFAFNIINLKGFKK